MFKNILGQVFLGNRLYDYLFALVLFALGFLGIKLVVLALIRRIKSWAAKTRTTLDDFLVQLFEQVVLPALYFGIFYLALGTLTLAPLLTKIINLLGVAVLTIVVARLVLELANYWIKLYWVNRGKDTTLERSLKGIFIVMKIVVWGLAVVFFLDNLGFKITSVIAGLGIGGVAVALAAQAVLGDLFSYFAILFDRPFEIGDFIIVGDLLGTVEYVGIKTTRIRSLGGEQLIFSNSDLTNSRVRNYKRMDKRRVLFKLGVTYQTPVAKLKKMPAIIAGIIKGVKDTVFDRAHFFSYGNFSLDFEVVYYVIGADYNKYMDIQQEINFAIKEAFEKEGIEFAYPTQTLYVEK
ncbi:MAG: mechanosensitive ion channel family protein [Candidatus Omnitrophica bacterium]|nr:mechanosensitive ion channel family protein [Candidatus Omnitrophota bacterium]